VGGAAKTREQIERIIDTAFAGVEMPGSAAELTSGGIDGPYVVEHFLGKRQAEVASGFLPSLHMEDFSYMTTEAVAYYLPVVLKLMLRKTHDDDLWIYLRGFLAPARGERHASGVHELQPAQLRAIGAWANYLHHAWLAEPSARRDARKALALAVAYGEHGVT
jgi:hypothetical protein